MTIEIRFSIKKSILFCCIQSFLIDSNQRVTTHTSYTSTWDLRSVPVDDSEMETCSPSRRCRSLSSLWRALIARKVLQLREIKSILIHFVSHLARSGLPLHLLADSLTGWDHMHYTQPARRLTGVDKCDVEVMPSSGRNTGKSKTVSYEGLPDTVVKSTV